MARTFSIICLGGVLLALTGCASVAVFDNVEPDWQVTVQPEGVLLTDGEPRQVFGDTTFGQYAFRVEREGQETFYGRLPLEFQDQRLLWDILFPPLYLFNLRAAYPHYAFDPDAGVIRYRATESDPWQEHKPTVKEIRRAKSYFRAPN